MIPATSFLLDGDTAKVVYSTGFEADVCKLLDRPCDTCDGGSAWWTAVQANPCPDCSGTGRHTFDIEVQTFTVFYKTITVHVIDVLPIERYGHHDEARVLKRLNPAMDGKDWYIVTPDTKQGEAERLALPPDAAPGMWLVRLRVIR